jgi:hypothetical protein
MSERNGIELFDGRGAMLPLSQIEPQITDDETRQRFEKVRAAYTASMAADDEAQAAVEAVESCMTQFDNAKEYLAQHFRQPTRMEETKRMIAFAAEQRARQRA